MNAASRCNAQNNIPSDSNRNQHKAHLIFKVPSWLLKKLALPKWNGEALN